MGVPEWATSDVLLEWARLADATQCVIQDAALPVSRLFNGEADRPPPYSGAFVDVDPFTNGGVFVSWEAAEAVTVPAMDAVEAGRTEDPAIERSGGISLIMIGAIAALLTSAGFSVIQTTNEYRPLDLEVTAGPAVY